MRLILYFAAIFAMYATLHFIFYGSRAPLWSRLTQPLIFAGALFIHVIALHALVPGASRVPPDFYSSTSNLLWTIALPSAAAAIAFVWFIRIAARLRGANESRAWSIAFVWAIVWALAWAGWCAMLWIEGAPLA
jgi:hypothetical protein